MLYENTARLVAISSVSDALMVLPTKVAFELTVMISGGFALAYQATIPAFEKATGTIVRTLSGASQGHGPKTIRYQLEQGSEVDVVILSNEGLGELVKAGSILEGSAVELATAPLAAAVRLGTPKPNIATIAALARSLSEARLVTIPGSTSGLFISSEVFSKLGIADVVRSKIYPRGSDSADALAAGEADIALGPVSELVNVPGIELVGLLPDEVQLVQTFTAAIVARSRNPKLAKQVTTFLSSDHASAAIRNAGMEPVHRDGPA